SGDSASSSAVTPRAANDSTSAFLTTPRSCSGEASKSKAEPTSTEKRRFTAATDLASSEGACRRERRILRRASAHVARNDGSCVKRGRLSQREPADAPSTWQN